MNRVPLTPIKDVQLSESAKKERIKQFQQELIDQYSPSVRNLFISSFTSPEKWVKGNRRIAASQQPQNWYLRQYIV